MKNKRILFLLTEAACSGKGGSGLCKLQEIQVQPVLLVKTKRGRRVICPQCQEAYPSNGQGLCLACRGDSPYLKTELI